MIEEFGIFGREFVEGDLQPFDPAANTFGEEFVLLDRVDQVLHHVQGVVQLFAECLLAAVAGLQHFHQARLEAAVGDRCVAEFGFDLRDRLQNVVRVVALIRRRIRRCELDFLRRALAAPRAPTQVQQFTRGLVDLRRTAFLVRRERVVRGARCGRNSVGGHRRFAHRSFELLIVLRRFGPGFRGATTHRPLHRFAQFFQRRERAALFEHLADGRIHVREHGMQDGFEFLVDVLAHLASYVDTRKRVVERPCQRGRTDRHDVFVSPRLGDHSQP